MYKVYTREKNNVIVSVLIWRDDKVLALIDIFRVCYSLWHPLKYPSNLSANKNLKYQQLIHRRGRCRWTPPSIVS